MSYLGRNKRWYTNVYVILSVLISIIALAMAGLVLLLLPRTSEIIGIMQWRMVNLRSFMVQTDVTWRGTVHQGNGDTASSSREAFEIKTNGFVDRWDPSKTELRQAFQLSVGDTNPTVYGGEYRRIGPENYLDLKQVPDKVGTLNFGGFRNTWLQFEPGKLLARINSPFIPKSGQTIDPIDQAQLLARFRNTPFLTVQKKLRDDRINGKGVHHYLVMPELIYFKDYFIAVQSARLGRELTSDERRKVDTFFANVTPEQGELWIGQGDYYLYRMRLRFDYDDGTRKGVLDLTADFSDFDGRPQIDPPSGQVTNVQPIIDSLLPSITGQLPSAQLGTGGRIVLGADQGGGLPVDTTSQANADPDGDGLPNYLEAFYGTDPHNPDTDGDGVSDGQEVLNGTNPAGPGKLFDFGISSFLQKNSSSGSGTGTTSGTTTAPAGTGTTSGTTTAPAGGGGSAAPAPSSGAPKGTSANGTAGTTNTTTP